MINVLWITPNLNHYKARFLNRLTENAKLRLTVLAGAPMRELGHMSYIEKQAFSRIDVNVSKKNFHVHPLVYTALLRLLFGRNYDCVLMPAEKKHIILIFFLFTLKLLRHFELVTYNHAILKSKGRFGILREIPISKFVFVLYDRIIFYTEQSKIWSVEKKVVPESKAFFANNTLETRQIWEGYKFEISSADPVTILFIGRLIPRKRVDLLIEYYSVLRKRIEGLQLIIIGDGPEGFRVREVSLSDEAVRWRGGVDDEELIAADMRQAHIVFVPGASGLSIVHAFCYGKPYVTLRNMPHGPELSYLIDGENGLLLDGNIEQDVKRVVRLLEDKKRYASFCEASYKQARKLSIENWCLQMEHALTDKKH